MGVVIQGEPSNRVALLIPLKTQHQFKMRAFIAVLACVGVVFAGEDMFGMKKMQKTWAEHKAMESCFGEKMMKTSLLKMKKAVVKCTGMDMPELDLPMYKSPHRFVHAMLDSHQDMEQMKVMGALKSMQQMYGQQQQPALQLVLGGQQQQVQKDDMFKKMMMKMMLKKMFNEDSSSPFGNMDSSSSDKFDMLKMLTQHMRSKRATDDIFELGDRLTEKLKSEQQKMQAQFGNASCVLQELDIVDQNLEIDVNAMVESVKKGEWGEFPDEWLKEHHIKDCRTCATFANSIPDLVFEDCPYGEKWGRIMMFFQCESEQKYKTCMNHDMKQKLEKSFGKIEDLEQATGLPEYQLLPLTMKLLHEQMDMFNM